MRAAFVGFAVVFAAVIVCSVMMCPRPIGIIDSRTKVARLVPCGQCIVCRVNYAMAWCFRNECEARCFDDDHMCFVTLTYDDLHCTGSLCKRDYQLFFKRLRKAGFNFRYFLCGEYGTKSHRPHYHFIMYGYGVDAPWMDDRHFDSKSGGFYGSSKFWPHGHIYIGYVSRQSIAYVCKYSLKAVKGKGATQAYDDKGLVRPFLSMSRDPGIGSRFDRKWLCTNNHFHFSGDFLKRLPLMQIKKLPRYYFDLLFPPDTAARAVFMADYQDQLDNFFRDDLPGYGSDDFLARSSALLLDVERKLELKHDRSNC